MADDREVASLLGEVDPGAFEEADAFGQRGSPLFTPLSSFAPSLSRFLRGTPMRPAERIQGYPTAALGPRPEMHADPSG